VGWRLYVFKGSEQTGEWSQGFDGQVEMLANYILTLLLLDLLHIQKQSAYLVGRDKTVVDIPVEHPSCSKQHAVIQCTFPSHNVLSRLPRLPG
jgi:smad nuclear-interacting protein 1